MDVLDGVEKVDIVKHRVPRLFIRYFPAHKCISFPIVATFEF
jgi:hypothetical protein